MANQNNFFGLNMRYGLNGVTVTQTNVSAIIQSFDNARGATEGTVLNQLGNTSISYFHDFKKNATFSYVHAAATTADGNSPVEKPVVGTKVTIGDSVHGASDIVGTNWIVQSVTENRMNTDCVKISVTAVAYDNIS